MLAFGEALCNRWSSNDRLIVGARQVFTRGPRIDIGHLGAWVERFWQDGTKSLDDFTAVTPPYETAFFLTTNSWQSLSDVPAGIFVEAVADRFDIAFAMASGITPGRGGGIAPAFAYVTHQDGSVVDAGLSFIRGTPEFSDTEVENMRHFMSVVAWSVCVAHQVLNCRNVQLVERTLSRAARRRQQKARADSPVPTWHVIDIKPFQRVVENDAMQHGTDGGMGRALHRCRAHFADYSQGRGLFGKHKGVFLISEHWRGDSSLGVIRSDYRLRPPPGGEAYPALPMDKAAS